LNNLTFVWYGKRDIESLTRDLQRVREIARETGFAPLEFHVEFNLGEVSYCTGDVGAAEEHANRAVALSGQLWGDTAQRFRAELLLARAALYRGDGAAAHRLLQSIRERVGQAVSAGRKDAELIATDELLAQMVELATRQADDEEWNALLLRCEAASAAQELIEVFEIHGLTALRQERCERAEWALREALKVSETAPGLLMNRILHELGSLPDKCEQA
jgi:hypothetical protein